MRSTPTLTPEALPGSNEARIQEAILLTQKGELDQAAAICQRMLERLSRIPARRRTSNSELHLVQMDTVILLADIYAQQGNWAAVEELCARAQVLQPERADHWLAEPLNLRVEHGDPQEGFRGLKALTASQPDNFIFWSSLMLAALKVSDFETALVASDYALNLIDGGEDLELIGGLYMHRFSIFQGQGEWRQAEDAWRTACQYDDTLEDVRETIVRMYLSAGLYDNALDLLDKVDDQSPGGMGAMHYRAWVANQRGDQVRARYLWRKLTESSLAEKREHAVVVALAYCWLRQEDRALGLLLADAATRRGMEYVTALTLALAWAMHGDGQAALANIKLATTFSRARRKTDLAPALDWIDFEQLVEDEALKGELRPYFEAPLPGAVDPRHNQIS